MEINLAALEKFKWYFCLLIPNFKMPNYILRKTLMSTLKSDLAVLVNRLVDYLINLFVKSL